MKNASFDIVIPILESLELPRPQLHEPNANFRTIETWPQLVHLSTQKSLLTKFTYVFCGISHVFECRINTSDLMEEKRWKIYRRYRHFEHLVTAVEAVSEIVLPKLSKRYIDCFKTTRNEDRLVQLRTWLDDVVGRIGRYYQTGKEFSSERISRCDTHQNIQSLCSSPTDSLASLLASFLLSGANVPIPSYIPRLPAFALSAKEINIQLFKRPMYPSKVRSSCLLSGGLGIRLAAASKCQRTGDHIGAIVYDFLCENSLLDSELTHVPVGSQLILINGQNVQCQNFDDILNELQSVALPLRLRFSCVPVRSLHQLELHDNHTKPHGTTNRLRILHERNVKDNLNCQSTIAQQYLQQNKLRRGQIARSQTAFSILGSVFTELIGMKGTKMREFFYGKKKKKSSSWDDFGAFKDTFSTGFYTFLSSSVQIAHSNPSHNNLIAQSPQRFSDPGKNTDDKRGEIGVWSTTEGGHPLSLCVGHVGDCEAAVLERTLKTLDKKEVNLNVNKEQFLERGYILVSINGESTFGKRFSQVVEMLIRASRPTTLCFRVFQDHKPLFDCNQKDDTEFYAETVLRFLSEAHRDMTNSLQVAVVENAAIRAKCHSIEQTVWKLESFACKETELLKETQRRLDAARDENFGLHNLLGKRDTLIKELQGRSQCLETKLKQSQHSYEISAERARSQALDQIANQEAKLLNESNKSIELLHRYLEEKFTREKVLAIQRLKSQHGEYLQKLAEEHSEEVESLNQQIAVWRHQVDVLTEAERRTYLTRHKSLGHMYTPRCVVDSTLANSMVSNIRESRHLVHSANNGKAWCKCEGTSASLHKGANTSITTRWQFNESKSASITPGSSTESNEDSLLSEVKEDYMEGRRATSNMETSRNCSTLKTIWNRVVSIVS